MEYIEEIIIIIQEIASGNFSARINIRGDNENLDSIANGINMLGEEIEYLFNKRITFEVNLKKKVKNLENTVDFTRETEIRIIEIMKEVDNLRKELDLPAKYFID
jgi:hypothetical protein